MITTMTKKRYFTMGEKMALTMHASEDRHRELGELIGKTVSFATFRQTDAGYDRVWLYFEDGSDLEVVESSPTGEFRIMVS